MLRSSLRPLTLLARQTRFLTRAFTSPSSPNTSPTPNLKNDAPDFSKFGWKPVAAILLGGGSLWGYFEYEKQRMRELKRQRANQQEAGKPLIGGPWSLVDHFGKPVTSNDFHGQYLFMYFGYTFCPDVCPEELDKMAIVIDKLKAQAPDTRVSTVFISCDPKRDSVESLRQYVKEFHKDFIGLTGTHQQIKRVAKAFRLYYSAPPKALDDDDSDYLVDHSIFFYLIDPQGNYISHFGRQETAESITAKTLKLFQNK